MIQYFVTCLPLENVRDLMIGNKIYDLNLTDRARDHKNTRMQKSLGKQNYQKCSLLWFGTKHTFRRRRNKRIPYTFETDSIPADFN